MDISTLSKQLNIPIAQLREKAREAGFRISPRANKIDNYMAKQIIQRFAPKAVVDPTRTETEIKLPKVLSVKELAGKLGLDVTVVIKRLIENGVLATINEEIDYDTAAIVATDLGFRVSEEMEKTTRLGLGFVSGVITSEQETQGETAELRPPVVAIMGHVDHGKTTLLDAIRRTNVVEQEAGRITQHIGAYQVMHKNQLITFLDTPGHEAFAAMRARGANVTDVIVLVVAADDGVKPQTIEVINRARLSATPLIVAINKIDRPDANIERVKKELSDYGVLIEEWGGKVPVAKISAVTNQGVDELLDLILLQAEVLELKANPAGLTLATVIEAHVSKTQGPMATVLVQNGRLNLSDIVAVGSAFGKIRSMTSAKGIKVKAALPSTPVAVTGLSEVPQVGDILRTHESLEEAKEQALLVAKSDRAKKIQAKSPLKFAGKELNLILKVDVQGSLEAINEALSKLKNTEVKLNIIEEGAGEITENDILRAAAAQASIIGFHTRISPQASKLSAAKQVPVRNYEVIYELVEDLTRQLVDMLTPEVLRTDLGKAKVLAIFRTEKDKMIVGGTVVEGKLKDNANLDIKRGDEIVGKAIVLELQQNKLKTKEVLNGFEFGLSLKTPYKIQAGDLLVAFEEVVRKRTVI
ncbi:MAG: translation initiation factor IF-2 [Candidatus Doudnabacteria bacterium]|nr:translation initiation factor IF-2 [Candidatus Doudnabacteria bacterium]